MNTYDDIFRIFTALDGQNNGYIDKNTFLETMLQYSSSIGDPQQEEINRIKSLIDPYEKIHFQEFKDIYLQIIDKSVMSQETDRSQNSSSNESSDVDDSNERAYTSKASFITSPSSARKHGLDLLNQSRASLHKIINAPTHSDSDSSSVKNYFRRESDEWDELFREKERNDQTIQELQSKLWEEEQRYQNEKDQSKNLSERIYQLESQIHDIEINYKSETKRMKENHKLELENIEEEYNEKVTKLSDECSELRRLLELAEDARDHSQSLFEECQSKYDDLRRDYRILQSQLSECETTIIEYKRVASRQVTELQTERDQLELVNKDLYIELQALRHLPSTHSTTSESTEHLGSNDGSMVHRKQRVHSMIVSRPNHDIRSSTSNDISLDNVIPRSNSPSVESDMGRVVHLLTIENRDLVERIAHLETVGFYQKQRLEAVNCLSLADEMDRLTIEETRKALTVERETVKALRDYMEAMTIKLITLGHIDVFQLS